MKGGPHNNGRLYDINKDEQAFSGKIRFSRPCKYGTTHCTCVYLNTCTSDLGRCDFAGIGVVSRLPPDPESQWEDEREDKLGGSVYILIVNWAMSIVQPALIVFAL